MGFKEMKMMKSTEPSVDEAGKGMKKGGKTKKMAMGGGMPMGALQSAAPAMAAPAMGRRAMPARRPMAKRPDPRQAMMEAAMAEKAAAPMMRKKGGEVESKSMHAKEMRDIKGVKKELMAHEDKPASKGHKGLKSGGIAGYKTGGLIQKYATGGIVGYKDGGHCAMKSGGMTGFKANKKCGSF
jgi:hypothetical protein